MEGRDKLNSGLVYQCRWAGKRLTKICSRGRSEEGVDLKSGHMQDEMMNSPFNENGSKQFLPSDRAGEDDIVGIWLGLGWGLLASFIRNLTCWWLGWGW